MPAITPRFMTDLETRIQFISENEYTRLTQDLWWTLVGRTRTTTTGRDIVTWLLSTAMIYDTGPVGGNLRFDDLVSAYSEISPNFNGAGLELTRAQFTDTDGNGLQLASEWSAQIGAQMAYWPQQLTADFLMAAETPGVATAYDGKAFFAKDHPVNPYRESFGAYANLFTGAAAGTYPGAVPIGDPTTVEDARKNLLKVFSYLAGIKMPNGKQTRRLRPRALLVPPALYYRAQEIVQAKFISVNGGGSTDVEGLIKSLGYATPVMVPELAGYENDSTYYVAAEQITDSQVGGVIYLERDPFEIAYYGPQTQVELSRADKWQWHAKGRNSVSGGHPYLIFKCKAT